MVRRSCDLPSDHADCSVVWSTELELVFSSRPNACVGGLCPRCFLLASGDSRVWREPRAGGAGEEIPPSVLSLDTLQEWAPGSPLPWVGINS